MLLFSLSLFLSFSCLLSVALFNNACRDLPPSRALAIALGRLDPISMCAFDELAQKEPSSLQHTLKEAKSTCTLKEAKSTCGDSLDHPSHKLMQGDVWLGTDVELITSLAAREPELSRSPLPISACTLPLKPDNGFLAQLSSISNIKAVVRPPLEEQQAPACNSFLVTLSPGKKRVLPPAPNNNPFKRGKQSDESFSRSSKARFLFDIELDGKLFCREDQCAENAVSVPHQASHDAVQFNCIKHEAQISIVTGDSVDIKAGVNPSLVFTKVGNFQDPLHKSTTLVPLHVQDSEESLGDSTGSVQVLIETERAGDTQASVQSNKFKPLASLQADSFGIKAVRGQHTSNSMQPEPQLSMSPVYQDLVIQEYSSEVCTVLISHSMLLTSASHHMKTGMDSPKTPTVTKQLQREAKAKKEIRSSSKQSSKVVMAASTPSLLKFFQRAPTL